MAVQYVDAGYKVSAADDEATIELMCGKIPFMSAATCTTNKNAAKSQNMSEKETTKEKSAFK